VAGMAFGHKNDTRLISRRAFLCSDSGDRRKHQDTDPPAQWPDTISRESADKRSQLLHRLFHHWPHIPLFHADFAGGSQYPVFSTPEWSPCLTTCGSVGAEGMLPQSAAAECGGHNLFPYKSVIMGVRVGFIMVRGGAEYLVISQGDSRNLVSERLLRGRK